MIKKGSMRRITAMLVVIVMLFTIVFGLQITTYAAENNGVIQLSIYSMYGNTSGGSSNGLDLGHAWLVIENGTGVNYDFYNTTLAAGETVSIGTFGNVVDPDTGVVYNGAWLNLEAYKGWGTANTASLTITITAEQLSDVNEKCIDMNAWNLINNCSYFASEIWNSIAPSGMQVSSYFFPANFPSVLKDNIQRISGHQTNRPFAYNDYTGYCTNSTTFKHITPNRLYNSSGSAFSIRSSYNNYTSFPEKYNKMTATELAYEMTKYLDMN